MRLTVETGPLAGHSIALDRDRPLSVGSDVACDLRLPDPATHPQHAVIKALKDHGFGIKALRAGVRVNGAEIEAAPLQAGDRIEIGTTRLTFGTENPAGRASGPAIRGFRILAELGRGGMGMVYRAEQQSLHREVALKVLNKDLTRDPQFVQRFVAEARAAAKLQHPNVVQVFDLDHDGDTYYYAMELMHEGSLEGWLKQHGRMPVERALQVVADAASGLAYAESLGIVHRDIKPDNLMLDQHDTVKIADLGLARTEESSQEKLAGTPHFMAPEQVLKQGVDHRTDLYALGCTFYRLITGRTPFRGQTVKDILRAHVKDEAEPANRVEPSVPAEVAAIVARLMKKEPQDRYQSASELLAAVEALLQPPAKKGLWIGLAAAAVVVAGGAIWWAVNKPKEQTVVERYRDNPEALRLATENEQLKHQAVEDRAEIALLTARTQNLAGAPLAQALEQVATAHPGTRAAATATELSKTLRAAEAQQQQLLQQRLAAATAAATARQAEVDAALLAQDFGKAMAAIATTVPPEIGNEAVYQQTIAAQKQRIQAAANERLRALQAPITAAVASKDASALRPAMTALAAVIDSATGWPAELIADRSACEALLASGQAAIRSIENDTVAAAWTMFEQALLGDQGVLAAAARQDFGTAAAALLATSKEFTGTPAGVRAAQLAAALQLAEQFAAALDATADKGALQLPVEGGNQLVARWQREQGQLIVVDASKKPSKEVSLRQTDVGPEQWLALAAQVPTPPDGSRESYTALLLLAADLERARSYLRSLDKKGDDSGTGPQSFPHGPHSFELLLARLPGKDPPPWCAFVREEAAAGALLTAGLRALSERRNLAAASYLERVLNEYPHSLAVAALR